MATILKFKRPSKSTASILAGDRVISTTVNDIMLIIHHALHGTNKACQPKDRQLAAKLLGELSFHMQKDNDDDCVILSHSLSKAVIVRYPEMLSTANRKCNSES